MSSLKESTVERKLVEAVRKKGGLCEKWTSGTSGWPDRLLLLPGGNIVFAELKAPGKKPRPLQLKRHKQLRKLGFKVYVIDGPEEIGKILDEINNKGGDAK